MLPAQYGARAQTTERHLAGVSGTTVERQRTARITALNLTDARISRRQGAVRDSR